MKPRPLRYAGAIFKKLGVFVRKVELCLLQLGRSKEEERLRGSLAGQSLACETIFAVWEALLNLVGSCGVLETGCG